MEAALANNRRNELWVGVLLAVAMAVLGWLSLQVGAISGVGPTIDVVLRMKDAAGISAGATVSVAGVQVGRVEEMKLDRDTAVAKLAALREAGAIAIESPLEVVAAAQDALAEAKASR